MRRQRGSWREHDAALAVAWQRRDDALALASQRRDDALASQRRDDATNVIVLADWQASITPAP
jgi:hypothetical protein